MRHLLHAATCATALAASIVLMACGGGGSDADSDTPTDRLPLGRIERFEAGLGHFIIGYALAVYQQCLRQRTVAVCQRLFIPTPSGCPISAVQMEQSGGQLFPGLSSFPITGETLQVFADAHQSEGPRPRAGGV